MTLSDEVWIQIEDMSFKLYQELKLISFNSACNKSAELLPEGWSVSAYLEKNSGSLSLQNPDGEDAGDVGDHENAISDLCSMIAYAIIVDPIWRKEKEDE